MQRNLGQMLHIERATLSGVVATLVRKGFIDQVPDADDQRQRLLRITPAGSKLWQALPDPIAVIQAVSFEGADDAEVATAIRVLQAATGRLNDHLPEAANWQKTTNNDGLDHQWNRRGTLEAGSTHGLDR